MNAIALDTHQKALQVNLDTGLYGSFVEMGAGQEVARWFKRVGGGAGTVARAVGTFGPQGNEGFGDSGQGTGRDCLEATLLREYERLPERLDARRGGSTSRFVFASVFSNPNGRESEETSGWFGIRFQSRPGTCPSQIIIQVRFSDVEPARLQDAIGVLGVNLVYGARHFANNAEALISSLFDNLAPRQVGMDLVDLSGPAFSEVDRRALQRKLAGEGSSLSTAGDAPRGAKPSDRPAARRGRKPLCGGLIDSVHLAGMPKAA